MIHTVCNTVLKTTAICYDYNFCEKNSKFILKQPHTVHMVVLRRCVKGSVPIFSICLINTEKAGGREMYTCINTLTITNRTLFHSLGINLLL